MSILFLSLKFSFAMLTTNYGKGAFIFDMLIIILLFNLLILTFLAGNQSLWAFLFLMLFNFKFFEILITKDTLFSVWAVHVMFIIVLSFVILITVLALQKQILTLLKVIFDFFSIRKLIITKRAANLKLKTLI
jgi:hypothetical protein